MPMDSWAAFAHLDAQRHSAVNSLILFEMRKRNIRAERPSCPIGFISSNLWMASETQMMVGTA